MAVDPMELAKRVAALERQAAGAAARERVLATRVDVTERATGELAWALFARAKAAGIRGRLPATAAVLWRRERELEPEHAENRDHLAQAPA